MDPFDYCFINGFEAQFKTIRQCIDHMKTMHDRVLVKIEMLYWVPDVIFPDDTNEQMRYSDAVKIMITDGRNKINAWTLHFESHKEFFGATIYAKRVRETIKDFEKSAAAVLNVTAKFEMLNESKREFMVQQAQQAEENFPEN
ncbi:hypothetical protein AVEN_65186-1 [Araneus ventricosus]|uniref:Uncharacterized protein n=1 Tax=Araneus ventricosus TaxID=182803 RepID=A0A4Y2AFM0_ARAVE|nr:hypothetical protein AVEN_65186-1 [Araneus ventricosus]